MLPALYNRLYSAWSNYNTRKNLNKLYKRYASKTALRPLSREQECEIQDYYQSLIGRKVSTRWHQLLYSITGTFTPRYLPFDLYHKLINKLSPWKYIKILDDKNLYRQILYGFNIPQRIVECSLGKPLLIEKQQVIGGGTLKDVVAHLDNTGTCILKPSISSSSGNGIIKADFHNGIDRLSGSSISAIVESMGNNYVVEKPIAENNNLSRLNPSSCNTLRIHTYRDKKAASIKYVSAFMRIGRDGAFVDNGGKGGICVSVDNNGKLKDDTAWTSKSWSSITHTDNGIKLDGYQIDGFKDMIATACRAHLGIHHFDFIGWDMAIDQNNNVVIIEFNPDPDMRLDQAWFKDTCLGDLQEEILSNLKDWL